MKPGEVTLLPQVLSVDPNGRFALQESHSIRNAELWRNAQAHVDVIAHRMPLYELNAVLPAKLPKNPTDVSPKLTENSPLAVFRHEDDVISTIPAYMRLALPFSHLDPLSL